MIRVYDDDGEEVAIPRKWVICSCCRGSGKSSAYLGSWSAEEWGQEDEGFQQDYMRGTYDRACDECDGQGRVQVGDYETMSDELKKQFDAACEEEASYQALCAMERRMEA